jgi:hypothetical protein
MFWPLLAECNFRLFLSLHNPKRLGSWCFELPPPHAPTPSVRVLACEFKAAPSPPPSHHSSAVPPSQSATLRVRSRSRWHKLWIREPAPPWCQQGEGRRLDPPSCRWLFPPFAISGNHKARARGGRLAFGFKRYLPEMFSLPIQRSHSRLHFDLP